MADFGPEDIAANVRDVQRRVREASARSGRSGDAVRLVAVSKTKPAWMIAAARDAGQTLFGENYVQEALAKQEELRTGARIAWHLVGALQTNKAKQVVGRFELLHAVDSVRLAQELDRRAGGQQVTTVDVLVEVNIASEGTKAGVTLDALPDLLAASAPLKHVRVRGLMSMPPPQDGAANRPWFRALASLSARLRSDGFLPADASELSMGTTSDFEAAIEEGATLVRVGTAIFGPRQRREA